jgi:hypothetical protein
MFIIDIMLKNTPLTLSVQRETDEAAAATYQEVMNAIQSGQPQMLELNCDRQKDKKVAILTTEVSAVQVSEKSGTAASSGRPPGFFALAE